MPRVAALRIVFDKNVPVGVRRFLTKHKVRTFVEMQCHPQLENGGLLKAAEASGFDVMVSAKVEAATPGSYEFIEMPLPSKRRRDSG